MKEQRGGGARGRAAGAAEIGRWKLTERFLSYTSFGAEENSRRVAGCVVLALKCSQAVVRVVKLGRVLREGPVLRRTSAFS